ncbi:hypothetical protein BS47DRAFT_1014804 [Hydnum rufescens UP504]|uniref:Uncharacterized protein n=1 Tax=Hydnum rufescens UP504 TaxID=1448309 RepID=A0A9P6AWE7_9AGAM|nr:hypothetical protein BS47DRAFT_1014804 [Hydnum rufescens UP504]
MEQLGRKRGPGARRRPHPHWDEPQEPQPVVSYGGDNLIHPESPSPFSTDNLNGNGVSPSRSTAPSVQQHLPTVKPKKRGKRPKNKVPRTISLDDPGAWDDRALMDAWNAANEEYERMHGPGQKWKNEPVHKASLWYAETKIIPQEDQANGAGW